MATWKRLKVFWLRSDCPRKFKLQVYHAVVRAKLMYGLESLQLTSTHRNTLDVFYLKGLRQILGMQTTFVNRHNTNKA
eukprot:2900279-Prorocentrum_lima.AAC.1